MNTNSNILRIKDLTINSKVTVAPLAGITDYVFRSILRQFNNTSLISTEMISSEALQHRKVHRIIEKLDQDHPIAYQLSGHKPEVMLKSALKIQHLADIIDVNMGCPIPKIVKNGDGSALMKTPEIAAEIVKTLSKNLEKPVSVKMRLGWDNNNINCIEFARLMEDNGAAMITVHGRTRNQMYAGKAKWKKIALVKQAVSIPVIANGDIFSPEAAGECLELTGCDGVSIGRGILGDPWLLHRIDHYLKTNELLPEPTIIQRLDMAIEHCKMLVNSLEEYHGIRHSRKFFGWYIKSVPGAAVYRAQLMQIETLDEVISKINEIKESLN